MIEQTISYTDMVRRMTKKRIGDLLLDQKIINESQLEKALELQRREGSFLGEVFVKQGLINYEKLLELLSAQLDVPVVNTKGRVISREILDLIPGKFARERNIIPLDKIDNKLIVAMGRPEDLVTIDDISLITGLKIYISLSNPSDIEKAITLNYGSVNQLNIKEAESEINVERHKEEDEAVIDFSPAAQNLNKIINQAVYDCASDIHMEPYKNKLRIRFRIDGVLQDKYLESAH